MSVAEPTERTARSTFHELTVAAVEHLTKNSAAIVAVTRGTVHAHRSANTSVRVLDSNRGPCEPLGTDCGARHGSPVQGAGVQC